MHRSLFLTCLAQGALARFPGIDQLANVVAAADDPGVTACAAAEEVASICVNEIPDFTDAPASIQEGCLCCFSQTNIALVYADCANYIAESAPKYSTEYTLFSAIAGICADEPGGFCRTAGGPTPTGGSGGGATTLPGGGGSSITSTAGPGVTARPAGCTSLASMLQSCSKKIPGFTTADDLEVASCVCLKGTTYTTAFDGYAESCASYLSTADTSAYTVIAPLTTFCLDNKQDLTPTPTPTRSTTSSRQPQSTVTVGPNGSPLSTLTSSGRADQVAATGPLAWLANLFTFFLSFFFLL